MNNTILHTHKELIENCKLGNRNAQYSLYKLYVDAMFNVAMRMVKIKPDAEDIIQESFIEAFKKLASFRYESTFGAWLKRIVVNKSINHLKLKKIPIVPLEKELYKITDDDIETNINDFDIDIKKISKAIKMLPNGFQQIINLYLIEGYDHIEIAEILGISSSTSKSQYHRAKKKIIKLINEL